METEIMNKHEVDHHYFDWTTNYLISFFLSLAMLDYLIYFALFLYVFFFILKQKQTIFRRSFGIIIVLLFTAIRTLFIPLLLNTIPWDWKPAIPNIVNEITFYSCTVSYIIFFNLPVLACIYFLVKFGTKGEKLKFGIQNQLTGEIPTVVVVMPIYNEEPVPLFRAIESAIRSDYPSKKLHLVLSFDDAAESNLYWALLKKLRILNQGIINEFKLDQETNPNEDGLFPPRLELNIESVRVTICRFPHEGKSATQGKAFQIINELYGQTSTNTHVMFIDSDVILHDNAIYNFVSTMNSNPRMKAVTGYITCRTSDQFNFLHYLQDAEYLEGQMFARCLEALAGSVTCLPGALTLIRLSAMQLVAPQYFIDFDKTANLHYHRYYLGEDRYMTHLLMEITNEAYSIGLCGASWCKTDAPDNWFTLIKQRRRWYLGALINETYMLTTPKLWKTMPILLALKLFDYSSGSLSWLFMIYLLGIIKNIVPIWTILVFLPCLVFKYLVLSINASFMNRSKVFFSFPIFFFVSPVFKLYCTVYSIYTWSTRSWGGPRTDVKQGEKLSKIMVLDDLMKERKMTVKRNKKMMKQIKKRAKILNYNLENRNEMILDHASDSSTSKFVSAKSKDAISLKKLLPFPYEVAVLGGGEYFDDLIYPDNGSNFETMSNESSIMPSSTINLNDSRYLFNKMYKNNISYSLDKLNLFKVEQLGSDNKSEVSRLADAVVKASNHSMVSLDSISIL